MNPYVLIVQSQSGSVFFVLLYRGPSPGDKPVSSVLHGHLDPWEVGQLMGGN